MKFVDDRTPLLSQQQTESIPMENLRTLNSNSPTNKRCSLFLPLFDDFKAAPAVFKHNFTFF